MDNLLIQGDNLDALRKLKIDYAGKVKLAFLDPPYNPRGDKTMFTYANTFKEDDWQQAIRARIESIKGLLQEDGFLAITIDHYELFYIGAIADAIFGRDNRLAVISVESNPGGRTNSKHFSISSEYCLVYAKDKNKAVIGNFDFPEADKKSFNKEDSKGRYRSQQFRRGSGWSTREERPNSYYPIYYNTKTEDFSLEPNEGFIEILPIDSEGKERVWRQTRPSFLNLLKDGDIEARLVKGAYKVYLKDRLDKHIENGRKPKTMWYDPKYAVAPNGTMLLRKYTSEKFSYPKSLYFMQDLVKILTDKDSIVLDIYAGSGTTAHGVAEQNKEDGGTRRWILIEELPAHIGIIKERLTNLGISYGC